ncbi:MAG: ThuA domain-containing protein [bacterium]
MAVLPLVGMAAPADTGRKPARLLVVSVTKGYRHESIPALEQLVADIGTNTGRFGVRFVRTDADLAELAPAALAAYDGVVFANTTGDLPLPDREGFVSWIEAGHAFVGIHAATDTFPGFPRYLDMIGGQFADHGEQTEVELRVADARHPATSAIGPARKVKDEIYQFKRFDPARVHLLLSLDKHPETGAPGVFPLAWTREAGKGRVFYTALGHREDVIASDWFRQHLQGGILWALRVK